MQPPGFLCSRYFLCKAAQRHTKTSAALTAATIPALPLSPPVPSVITDLHAEHKRAPSPHARPHPYRRLAISRPPPAAAAIDAPKPPSG